MSSLRAIPSVDKVLRTLGDVDLPRAAVVAIVRRELDAVRDDAERHPECAGALSVETILVRIRDALAALHRSPIQPVINGTGIIIHTNFGRSPLGAEVVSTIADVASN